MTERSWWMAALALAASVAVVMALVAEHRGRRVDEVERRAEAQRLRDEGRVVAAEEDSGAVRAELARVLAAGVRPPPPDSRVVATARVSTGTVVVPQPRAEAIPPRSAETSATPVAGTPPCLVQAGDSVEIRVAGVAARTRAGNTVVDGVASLWRTAPPPAAEVVSAPFSAAASTVVVDEQVAAPRPESWAVGPAAGLVGGHPAYGAMASTRPLTVGRVIARGHVLVLAGGGDSVLAVAGTASWR